MKVESYGHTISSQALKPGDFFATWLGNETHYCISAKWEDSDRRFYVVLSAHEQSEIKVPSQIEFAHNETVLAIRAAIIRPSLGPHRASFMDQLRAGSFIIHDGSAYLVCTDRMRLVKINLETGMLGGPNIVGVPVTIPAWEIVLPTPETGGYKVLFSCSPT